MKFIKKFENFSPQNISVEELMNILQIDITTDTWGGFEIGEGEYFKPDFLENLKSGKDNCDFVIITEVIDNDTYETTFIPNPITIKDTSSFTDEEWKKMFSDAVTYRTTKEDIAKKLINMNFKIGIWEFDPDIEPIIDDFVWYYLGLHDSGEKILEMPYREHPKTKELLNILKNK